MKTLNKIAAQGDVIIKRINKLPEGLEKANIENGKFTVAHSETMHHHTVAANDATLLIDKTNEFIAYLEVANDTELTHERSFDTHESVLIPKGLYEVRRQREYTAEGFRRAQD